MHPAPSQICTTSIVSSPVKRRRYHSSYMPRISPGGDAASLGASTRLVLERRKREGFRVTVRSCQWGTEKLSVHRACVSSVAYTSIIERVSSSPCARQARNVT